MRQSKRGGFGLVLIAILMVAASMVATTFMAQQENKAVWQPKQDAQSNLEQVEQALIAYQRENNVLPCPARRNASIADSDFGVAVSPCTTAAGGNTLAASNTVNIGALPTRTLGLPDSAASDKWGNKLTYAVTVALTNPLTFYPLPTVADSGVGKLAVTGNVTNAAAGYIVVSHGPDGKGAYTTKSGQNAVACNSASGADQANCDGDASFVLRDLQLEKGSNNYYDDQVIQNVVDSQAQSTDLPCLNGITANWSSGTRSCSGTFNTGGPAAILHGATTAAITNTSADTTGSATFTCNNGALVFASGTCFANCNSNSSQTWNTNCSGIPADTLHGNNTTTSNTAAGYTGSATFSCTDGTLNVTSSSCTSAMVNGACGAANGAAYTSAPAASLCSAGTAGSVTTNTSTYTWNCNGISGGSNASCTANRACAAGTLTWGGGCSASFSQINSGATSASTASTAGGFSGSATASCTGNTWGTPSGTCVGNVNGACGAANGASYTTTPAASLCSAGTAGAVTSNTNTYTWTCNGTGTGSNASCTANRACATATLSWGTGCSASFSQIDSAATSASTASTAASTSGSATATCTGNTWGTPSGTCTAVVNGACGAASGASYTSSPASALCTAGTPTAITTNTHTYTWSCTGSGGGTNSGTCTANRACAAGTRSWGAGCSASFAQTNSGATSASTNNTAGGYTGSATASCTGNTWATPSGTCTSTGGPQSCSFMNYVEENPGTETAACGPTGWCVGTAVAGPCGSDADVGTTGAWYSGGFGDSPYCMAQSGFVPGQIQRCRDRRTVCQKVCSCTNGANNAYDTPPCTTCGSGKTMVSGTCENNCSSASRTWTVGGDTCTATVPATNAGASGSATDSTSPVTGSASFSCSNGTLAASPNAGATCANTSVNGACGGSSNSCSAGSPSGYSAGSCGGNQTWTCNGSGGGSNASCSLANAACVVNGACGGSSNSCSAGSPSGYSAGSCGGNQTWTCNGSGGGSNASCTLANAACTCANGATNYPDCTVCGDGLGFTRYVNTTCPAPYTAGFAVQPQTRASCSGGWTDNGAPDTQECSIPGQDGVCDTVSNSCVVGTPQNYAAGTCGGAETWECAGVSGGLTENCSIANAACASCSGGTSSLSGASCQSWASWCYTATINLCSQSASFNSLPGGGQFRVRASLAGSSWGPTFVPEPLFSKGSAYTAYFNTGGRKYTHGYIVYDGGCNIYAQAAKGGKKSDYNWGAINLQQITSSCPVNGGWGAWSTPYCACACGASSEYRSRNCDNPTPSGGGAYCVGAGYEDTGVYCEDYSCCGGGDSGGYYT